MPRVARLIDNSGAVYHVTCRGNNRNVVFHDDDDRKRFRTIILGLKREIGFKLYHQSLMPNHYHLQIYCAGNTGLAIIMQRMNLKYSLYHQFRYGNIGRLWQERFYSRMMTNDADALVCGIYIELNSVRAGLVGRPEDDHWSSARVYLRGVEDGLTDIDPVYLGLGKDKIERRKCYRRLLIQWQKLS